MKHSGGWLVVMILLLAGAFFTGIGFQQMRENQRVRTEYEQSSLLWKREMAAGLDAPGAKDLQNQILLENKEHIAMEEEIYFESAGSKGNARIANGENSEFSCTVTLFEDASGEVLYESGLIEPGHYIEWIELNKELIKGHHPCTAIWSFYSAEGEAAGELAGNVVLVIKN